MDPYFHSRLNEVANRVEIERRWIRNRQIQLIISAMFIALGIVRLAFINLRSYQLFSFRIRGGYLNTIFEVMIWWAIGGAILSIGAKKSEGSVKSQVQDALFEYDFPISNMILNFIFKAVFAPFLWLANFIGYLRTKKQYKIDQEELEELQEIRWNECNPPK
ncbi:MAG: hypothetical protein J5653_04025 [Clostridiales bacterium]|nr:hypothetical protein [Clostridiales bacterium]